ncbi:hypothetical protein [Nakamurella leprariae]|uniref:hypothetical protein n=1 Tax=Nakamurella leprariae TaxID=2803911 RepID=UPI002E281A65|nr:hypothetical protein [Nakamurella leprariae]
MVVTGAAVAVVVTVVVVVVGTVTEVTTEVGATDAAVSVDWPPQAASVAPNTIAATGTITARCVHHFDQLPTVGLPCLPLLVTDHDPLFRTECRSETIPGNPGATVTRSEPARAKSG